MKFQKIIEASGIFFAAFLVLSAIAFAAFTRWSPGGAPEVGPGEGNVVVPLDFDEDGIVDWNDWDDTDPQKKNINLLPKNVKSGVNIFGVVGNMTSVEEARVHCRVQNGGYGNCAIPSDWCELNTDCQASCNAGSCGSNCGTPCWNSITTTAAGGLTSMSYRCPGQTRIASIECTAF